MSQDVIDAVRALRIELQRLNERVAAAAGLNPRDLDVLDVVDRDGPCTPSFLAPRTGLRAATLTGVLARLERDGWVTRTPDPADARSVLIASTERFDELRELYTPEDSRALALADSLGAAERAVVLTFLRSLAAGDSRRESS